MGALPKHKMTADEFIAWAMEQPETEHYELVAGEIVPMSPERMAHAEIKGELYLLLRLAVRQAGIDCQVLTDGMAVAVDDRTIYEPDLMVRCGSRLPADAIVVADPLIVAEVTSPSSRRRDSGAKLDDYFRIPSVRHYLIVKTENRTVIHHRRDAAGAIATTILRGGELRLDPPGIAIAVEAIFA